MHSLRRRVSALVVLIGLVLVGAGHQKAQAQVGAPAAVVLVADGAGNFQCTSKALRQFVTDEQLPLWIETFVWSHGKFRVICDMLDKPHIQLQGQLLARRVMELRQTSPSLPIFLVGHCAGCEIVLAAGECLPPGTIERMILLQPSAHSWYDLVPSLHATRDGIDVFYSEKDTFCLGLGAKVGAILGGKCCPAAGRVGFQPLPSSPEAAAAYAKLRQYPWTESQACTGHNGGHFGCYKQDFLRNFVVPLMLPP